MLQWQLFTYVVNSSRKPYLSVKINGAPLKMELDTGSTLTCISKHTFEVLNLRQCKLVTCNESLRVANYDSVLAPYKDSVQVEFRDDTWVLPLYIVDCKFPTLLGRKWITTMFGTDWLARIVNCGGIAQLVELLIRYTLVKSDVTGSIPGVSHIFRIVWIIIPACLIKQPNGTLSRMYVQTYISVK